MGIPIISASDCVCFVSSAATHMIQILLDSMCPHPSWALPIPMRGLAAHLHCGLGREEFYGLIVLSSLDGLPQPVYKQWARSDGCRTLVQGLGSATKTRHFFHGLSTQRSASCLLRARETLELFEPHLL